MTTTTTAVASDLLERNRARFARAEAQLDRARNADRPLTETNVLRPFNEIGVELSSAASECGLMAEVHPDPEVRAAADTIIQELSAFSTRLGQDRPLYTALGGLDPSALGPLARRVVELARRDMRRTGTELSDADQERVRTVRAELVKVEQEFAKNIRDNVQDVALDPAQLEGLPPDYVAAHSADANGKVHVTTNYPDLIPFMTYAKDESARKALAIVNGRRAVPENVLLLEQMLAKRAELATLLGYTNWAEYASEDKMTGSAAAIRDFIDRALAACRDSAAAEYTALVAEKGSEPIGTWDTQYLLERVKARKYSYNGRELRPYFEYRAVRQAILDLSSELFGLAFTPVTMELWHPSVETFAVRVDGREMGHISLDMHPREGKFKHAACFTLVPGFKGRSKPHGVLVCNFPDPNAQQGPALMEHSEVVTYFHEFGHLVHGIVSGDIEWARVRRPSEWDFIEAPSQFLEEWIYDYDVLRRFAKHVETGAVIPEALVRTLRDARDFGRGTHVQRQLMLSAISLRLHDRDPRGLDTTQVVRDTSNEFSRIVMPEGTAMQASFGHLEGYTALYYTYMWSLVIAKDMHGAFANGLMDLKQAKRYRDLVLAPGGTKPAGDLVQDFLGRSYGFDAFREWLAPRD
ncbi:MAG TPA: M3 family metallopeptidase [Candidatus Limnocylindria bacterium]|nr:M3 family metallopeptidase [Candidatus Limnocylindria bacterium]